MNNSTKNKLTNNPFELANSFALKTIASVEELPNYDMIYIYHHLKVGSQLWLKEEGTNVKGDLRFKVFFKEFVLGFVTIGGTISKLFENSEMIVAEILNIEKQKFLPIRGLDITLQATKMRMVS